MDFTIEAFLDVLPAGVVVCDKDGTVTYSNRAAKLLYQHPHPEGLRLPQHSTTMNLYTPAGDPYRPEDLPLSRSALEGLVLQNIEVVIRWADGQSRTLLCNTTPLSDSSGIVSGAIGVFRDVTDYKKVDVDQERLRTTSARERAFLDRLVASIPLGLAVLEGPDYRFAVVNQYFRERLAQGRNLVGMPVGDAWPEAAAAIKQILDTVRQTLEPFQQREAGFSVSAGRSVRGRPEERYFDLGVWPLGYDRAPGDRILILVEDATRAVRARERATALRSVIAEITLGRDLREVLESTMKQAIKLLGGEDGALFLFEEGGTRLRGEAEMTPRGRVGLVVPIDDWPLVGRVVSKRSPRFITPAEASGHEAAFILRTGLQGSLACPLMIDSRCLGLVFVNYHIGHAPSAEDLAFAASFAEHCAVAIDRAQVHEERARLLEAERSLRAQAEAQSTEMRTILEWLGDGVVVRDHTGRAILTNRRLEEITGVPAADLVDARRAIELLTFLDRDGQKLDPAEYPVSRILAGETVRDLEITYERAGGDRRNLLVSGGPVVVREGQPPLTVTTTHDITELRRLEKAKDEFLQVLAHELRNPLAAAFGLVQLSARKAKARPEGDPVAEYLRLAEIELSRLSGLVNDILTGYRVSSGRLSLLLRAINLADVIARALEPFRSLFQARVVVSPLPRPELPVLGDEERLAEVATNLLSNALKYSPEDTRVEIEVSVKGSTVEVRVLDRGVGIPPDQLEQVFSGFHRATNLSSRQPGGLGLGLYISRDIAERHGGRLWAENREGGGTILVLQLPLVEGAAARQSADQY